MGGKNSGRHGPREPMSDEMKAHLRAVMKGEEKPLGKTKKSENVIIEGGSNTPASIPVLSDGGARGGVPGNSGHDPSGSTPSGDGGKSVGVISPSPRIGNKIQKLAPEVVVFDANGFFKGLPAFARLTFKAFNNLFKLFNLLPLPFSIEVEDMNNEEAELFSEAIKPGLTIALPNAGKKHPFWMMGWAFFIGVLGKITFKRKERKNVESKTQVKK